tara:strand:+ start:171 stop:1295 length:1125 start_codon:yes stop_codon:yes gene_type:complete
MIFQVVDTNEQCKKVFVNGKLVSYEETNQFELNQTWKHSMHLNNTTALEYAFLWSKGDLDSACPGQIKEQWDIESQRIKSIMKSVMIAKCDVDNTCIYDYIPEKYLIKYLALKEQIIKNIFSSQKKPSDYRALERAHILCEEMNVRKNIFDGKKRTTNYNVFGTRTGRLSNKSAGIPILTMKKEDRVKLQPRNDLFVEFDFNAAEIRTLLALNDKEQPKQDIHTWNTEVVANGSTTRDEMKKRFFAWLYNPKAEDRVLSKHYDKNAVLDKYWNGKAVVTPYGRTIPCDREHALNYLVQSTSSDVCIEQAFKVREILKDCKTQICYLLHDSVVLDFTRADVRKFDEIQKVFSETRFGNYLTSAKIGKNFRDMTEV